MEGKMSAVLARMAYELKKEEDKPNPIPPEIPSETASFTETPTAQSLFTQREISNIPTTSHTPSLTKEPVEEDDNVQQSEEMDKEAGEEEGGEARTAEEGDEGGEAEGVEEGCQERDGDTEEIEKNEEKSVEKRKETASSKKAKGMVVLEKEDSSDDERTLNKRAMRRSRRIAKRKEVKGTRDMLEETNSIVSEGKCAADRKRKGKQVAVPNKKKKPRQASLSMAIQESARNLIRVPYNQSDEEDEEQEEEVIEISDSEGVYEKLVVKVDKNCWRPWSTSGTQRKGKIVLGEYQKGRKPSQGRGCIFHP